MRISSWPFARQIASVLVLLLAVQVAAVAQQPSQQSAAAQTASRAQDSNPTAARGTAPADKNAETAALTPPAAGMIDAPQAQSTASSGGVAETSAGQEQRGQEQNSPAKPAGTAAAPEANPAGIAGSRLTGAAVAPAKQRRIHVIAIRIAVVVGACVAIGTVAALSHSSPSQPR